MNNEAHLKTNAYIRSLLEEIERLKDELAICKRTILFSNEDRRSFQMRLAQSELKRQNSADLYERTIAQYEELIQEFMVEISKRT